MACVPGYFGQFCNESCPPGTFGDKCGGRCYPECTEMFCHHENGCQHTNNTTHTKYTDDVYIDLETTKLKDTNSTSHILDRNTFYVTENPIQNSGLYSNYLIVGVGVVISMFLFMILIQLCKNSRTAKRNKFTRQKRNTNEKPDESSHPRTYRENKEYKTISSSRNSSRLYRPMDIVYHEIDECMEMMPTPTFQNVASKLDCNTVPLDLKHHSSLKRKYDDDQTRKLHLLPSTKITCSDRDKSKLNPQPENVLENIDTANKEETVFYANATK